MPKTRRMPLRPALLAVSFALAFTGSAIAADVSPVTDPTTAAPTASQTTPVAAPAASADATMASPSTLESLKERERNLVDYISRKFAVPEKKAMSIVSAAYRNAMEHHTHPELILAVIAVESEFREKAKNGGAMGLMQIIPRYHKSQINAIGGARELYDPVKNIRTGTHILMDYLRKSGGDMREALMRYKGNLKAAGESYADKILSNYEKMRQINDAE